jgi:hypothetical protein
MWLDKHHFRLSTGELAEDDSYCGAGIISTANGDGLSPKLLPLMIGTNHANLPKKGYTPDSPEDSLIGIQAILDELRRRLPQTRGIIFSIFPREPAAANEIVRAVNARLPQLADQKQVFHEDINATFLGKDGKLNPVQP